jgi:hypothetical protein
MALPDLLYVEKRGGMSGYGMMLGLRIRRRHAASRTSVYTKVYTGVENSGLLGPHASKRPQPEMH